MYPQFSSSTNWLVQSAIATASPSISSNVSCDQSNEDEALLRVLPFLVRARREPELPREAGIQYVVRRPAARLVRRAPAYA